MSLCVHLGILLTLSAMWYSGQFVKSIVLDGKSVERVEDFESLSSLSIELPVVLEPLEMSASELDSVPELTLDALPELEFDLAQSAADSFNGLERGEQAGLGAKLVSARITGADSTGFFGVQATGNRVVYLIDMSPSMVVGRYQRRYDRAVDEVLRSVDQLKPDQEFFVYLFCFQNIPMRLGTSQQEFCLPTTANKKLLANWLRSIRLSSGTDPRESLVAALKLAPTCIFLLSDGEFNGEFFRNGRFGATVSTSELARKFNDVHCPINTIGLEDRGSQAEMNLIAKQSGGTYKFVPAGE